MAANQDDPGVGDSLVRSLFVREDLSKPENRANVWLLAATSIGPFWAKLSRELGLSSRTVLRPEKNTEVGRPDLIARDPDGNCLGWIECENWGENTIQSQRYGLEKRILILGTQVQERGTSWMRIAELIEEVSSDALLDDRQRVVLDLLALAIEHILGLAPESRPQSLDRSDIPEGWLKQAACPLLQLQDPYLRLHAYAEGSVSVRLLGPRAALNGAKRNGVFLLMSQKTQPDVVFAAGPQHLARHLSGTLQPWVRRTWTNALKQVTGGLIDEDRRGVVPIRLQADAARASILAEPFSELIASLQFPET